MKVNPTTAADWKGSQVACASRVPRTLSPQNAWIPDEVSGQPFDVGVDRGERYPNRSSNWRRILGLALAVMRYVNTRPLDSGLDSGLILASLSGIDATSRVCAAVQVDVSSG